MLLSAEDIRKAFVDLSEQLAGTGTRAEIMVIGGAAIVMLFGARESTKDVDAYFLTPEASIIREAAAQVALNLGLPNDWLNDAAKGYVVEVTAGDVLHETPHLIVRAASFSQLLAMKLAAWRDVVDRDDAKLLLSTLQGSAEEVWQGVRALVPPHLVDKASYAFEDLWEALHGPR
jgi:hypothetical protein